jgi:hypothetical protein
MNTMAAAVQGAGEICPRPFHLFRRWRVRVALLLALLLALLAGAAHADPSGRVGRVSWLAGDVTLRNAGGNASPAQRNWPVTAGDRLATGPMGRAEVWIGSTALRIDVDSELEVSQLDDDQLRLQLLHGSMAMRVAVTDAVPGTAVQTPAGSFTPLEPGEFRVDLRGGPPSVSAWRGALEFVSSGSRLRVESGQRVTVLDAASGHYSFANPARDDFSGFVDSRDAAFDGRTATRYVSSEMTGIEDLDSYGHWTLSAEYGSVWVPAVGPDWAPYREGRCAWVDPWGWTGIDDAPWGFAPFHYGRWAMWEGRWAWVPGRFVARPVYAPALVGWIGTPGASVSVGVGGRVGWFPLAPREAYVPSYAVSPSYVQRINVTAVRVSAGPIEPPPRYVFQQDVRATTVVSNEVLLRQQPVAPQWRHGGEAAARPLLQAAVASPRPLVPAPAVVRPGPARIDATLRPQPAWRDEPPRMESGGRNPPVSVPDPPVARRALREPERGPGVEAYRMNERSIVRERIERDRFEQARVEHERMERRPGQAFGMRDPRRPGREGRPDEERQP